MDWISIGLYILLVLIGWISLYGASYDFDNVGILEFSARSGQQMIWILTSLVLAFAIMVVERDWYELFAYWIYTAIILLLILTIFLATEVKGSRSWISIGGFNLQSAEFAKFATALALAKLMSSYRFELMKAKNFLIVLGLIFLPMVLIFMQKETGSALVYLSFFFVLYREGMPGAILFVGFCMIVFFIICVKFSEVIIWGTAMGEFIVLLLILAVVFWLLNKYKKDNRTLKYLSGALLGVSLIGGIVWQFYPFDLSFLLLFILGGICIYSLVLAQKYWSKYFLLIVLFTVFSVSFLYSTDYVFDNVLKPHQQVRIHVLLGMKDDPGGAGYNVNQSKIAIGSGGLTGKGFLNGTQTKLKYVPEQDTDFIFCTVGEEHGFVGTVAVLFLFTFLILRLIFLAERQKSTFNRIYGYSVASILFFHLAINIGMVIGLTPVIGIPLPFFSYGGSSLWGFTILLFIFIRLDASRAERL